MGLEISSFLLSLVYLWLYQRLGRKQNFLVFAFPESLEERWLILVGWHCIFDSLLQIHVKKMYISKDHGTNACIVPPILPRCAQLISEKSFVRYSRTDNNFKGTFLSNVFDIYTLYYVSHYFSQVLWEESKWNIGRGLAMDLKLKSLNLKSKSWDT